MNVRPCTDAELDELRALPKRVTNPGAHWTAYLPRGGPPLTLARYNGPSHVHGDVAYRPHVHRATEDAIAAGRKPESKAEETGEYETLEGALACLARDFNVSGVGTRPDHPRLVR